MNRWGTVALILATLFALLVGCASDYSHSKLYEYSHLSDEEALVFGQIKIFDRDGKLIKKYYDKRPAIIVTRMETGGHSGWLITEKDGSFFWKLPKGTYQVSSIAPFFYGCIEPAPLSFSIPEAGKAYYLGTLRLDVTIKSKARYYVFYAYLADVLTGVKNIEVINEYIESKEYLEKKRQSWEGKTEELLMQYNSLVTATDLVIINPSESKYKDAPKYDQRFYPGVGGGEFIFF